MLHHKLTPAKRKLADRKKHLEHNLRIFMYIWAAAIFCFLVLFIYAPQLIYPASPGLANNMIIPFVPGSIPLPKPRVIVSLPGINIFKGKPSFSDNVSKFDELLARAADKYGLDCTLLKAQMMAESLGRPSIISSAGAVGLMQLLPSTARAMGFSNNLRDPQTSIMAGAKYLKHLESTGCYEQPRNSSCDTSADIKYQIAAYNGGSRCNKPAYVTVCNGLTIWECSWFGAYGETRNYVNRVKANYHYLDQNNWGC